MTATLPKYLCTLPLPDSWFAELATRVPGLDIHRARPDLGEPIPAETLRSAGFLHTSGYLPDVAATPSLRLVQLDTSGVDHLANSDLWASDIPIATLGGIAPVPMAEYALMSMLALAHRLPALTEARRERRWPTDGERLSRYTPARLAGSTVGIIGYGRIGKQIARLCTAFGMTVLGVRRSEVDAAGPGFGVAPGEESAETAGEVVSVAGIDAVLRRSDYLVVVVPLTPATRGLIGADQLDRLPPAACLVNIARGGVVDEVALLERVRNGRIAGVALDVFEQEPLPPESPWWSEPNVLVTPHVAGLASDYRARSLDLVVENLRRLVAGERPLNEVNRAVGY